DLTCPYSLLRQWATAGALLVPPDDTPARVGRVWISTGAGFVVLKFKMRGVAITPDVSKWLSQLAATQRQDYGKPLKKAGYAGQFSNVYPWGAATNGIAALVNGDAAAKHYA